MNNLANLKALLTLIFDSLEFFGFGAGLLSVKNCDQILRSQIVTSRFAIALHF